MNLTPDFDLSADEPEDTWIENKALEAQREREHRVIPID